MLFALAFLPKVEYFDYFLADENLVSIVSFINNGLVLGINYCDIYSLKRGGLIA